MNPYADDQRLADVWQEGYDAGVASEEEPEDTTPYDPAAEREATVRQVRGAVGQIVSNDVKPVPATGRVVCHRCHRALQNVFYHAGNTFGRVCITKEPSSVVGIT